MEKHLPKELRDCEALNRFITAVGNSYRCYERDRELSAHAFAISEQEYAILNLRLKEELALKQLGLQNIREAILKIEDFGNGEPPLPVDSEEDNLYYTLSYLSKLIQRQRQLALVARANQNGIVFTDAAGVITWANEGFMRLTGYHECEILGRTPLELCRGPLTEKDSLAKMLDAFYSGQSFTLEVIHYRRDGSWFWGKTTGQPVPDPEGKSRQYFAMFEDITEKKKLELALIEAKEGAEQSSRSKEIFLANMSHEIRTPMNAILGMAGQLRKTNLDNRQQRYLDTIHAAADHLLVVINDILDISKIEAGKLQIEQIGFSPGAILDRVRRVMQLKADEKGLKLQAVLDPQIRPVLIGDPHRLNQVLLNLVSNAIKFTEKGSVDIGCILAAEEPDKQQLRIFVKDTGIGMDNAFIQQGFDKFLQEDRSTARKYGGTGLGMSICRQLTQLMQGAIEIASTKGEGTTVTLTIPFVIGQPHHLPAPIAEAPDAAALLHHRKILLVEDNEMNRLVATTLLGQYGVIVVEAINGQEAIEKLRQESFDGILMDVQMPVMDGLEATRFIRRGISRDIPIIALTANAIKGEADKCLEAGMNAFVPKPFDEHLLIQTLARYLPLTKAGTDASPLSPDTPPLHPDSPTLPPHSFTLPPDEAPLYNLDGLRQIGRGDEAFVRRMLQLFLQQGPAAIHDMQSALVKQDGENLRAIAHRLKPVLDNMGIATLGPVIRQIETIAKQPGGCTRLTQQVARVAEIVRTVVKDIRDASDPPRE